jgi:hypothetical protein
VQARGKTTASLARRGAATKPWQRWKKKVSPQVLRAHFLFVMHYTTESKTNSAIKRVKLAARTKAEQYNAKTPSEMGVKKGSKNEKVRRPIFAVGGLDQDMHDWNGGGGAGKSIKKAAQRDASDRKFTDFDPNKKLRKGGKLANQSFKIKRKK